MDYKNELNRRSAEMRTEKHGKLQVTWQITDTRLIDTVRLSLPPVHRVPIIFVPGIMGSNLCTLRNEPVWLLDSVGSAPIGLAVHWAGKSAGLRQKVLHPDRTKVYSLGAVPKERTLQGYTQQSYLERGWGGVSQASYHKFLVWLEDKMNGGRNPLSWDDFTGLSSKSAPNLGEKIGGMLRPGLPMEMRDLPKFAEKGFPVEPVKSTELLQRARSSFPIYAFGYNWLESNSNAADALRRRIEEVIVENNVGVEKCTQVILITHSMGGLVARACSQLPRMAQKIVGIVHGVMPATGAAVAYRRCKVGMMGEDFKAGLVIGAGGKEVTAVFAQSPGALQLLPSIDYGNNWLKIFDPTGKTLLSLPVADPYEEIYLQRGKWWGLIREEWLKPNGGVPITWNKYCKNILIGKEFHRKISKHYHHNTYIFYGGGAAKGSFSKVRWSVRRGIQTGISGAAPSLDDIPNFCDSDVRTDGSNNLYVGGQASLTTTIRGDAPVALAAESSHWEIRCEYYDSAGDGTVPSCSGMDPRSNGGRSILQQFELDRIQHEPAYRDYPVAQQVTYYAVTKLAAMADVS